jgi:hypothetical protein
MLPMRGEYYAIHWTFVVYALFTFSITLFDLIDVKLVFEFAGGLVWAQVPFQYVML